MAGIWWLASYPKSGNTWLRAMLATLISRRPVDINAMGFLGPICSNRFLLDDTLGIDSADLSPEQEIDLRPRAYEIWAAEAERPLYCKVHDAYHPTPAGESLFPASATRGAVYVVRDPRAVAVSFAYHMGRPVEAAIARMLDPGASFSDSTRRLTGQLHQPLLRWSDHVESWLAAPFPLYLLRYEDMWTDPISAFTSVAAFLDLPCDPATIAAGVEATTFSRLQAQEHEAGFFEKPRGAGAFFREGSIDGWRRVLTAEQAGRIVAAHGIVMRRLGYDLTLAPLVAERGAA
jgi:aryl sulfotransferase